MISLNKYHFFVNPLRIDIISTFRFFYIFFIIFVNPLWIDIINTLSSNLKQHPTVVNPLRIDIITTVCTITYYTTTN